jgi:hypothetical protein
MLVAFSLGAAALGLVALGPAVLGSIVMRRMLKLKGHVVPLQPAPNDVEGTDPCPEEGGHASGDGEGGDENEEAGEDPEEEEGEGAEGGEDGEADEEGHEAGEGDEGYGDPSLDEHLERGGLVS